LAINAKAAAGKSERVKDMTRAQLAAVLAAIPEGRDRLFFEVLVHTGCRISEALGLDWSDLGQDGATLRIERQWYRGKLKRYTKTANGMRTITLPPGLARKLWDIGADQTGLMFYTRTGLHLSDRNMARMLKRAETAAGLPISARTASATRTAACCSTRAGRSLRSLTGSGMTSRRSLRRTRTRCATASET
jgi:integrase